MATNRSGLPVSTISNKDDGQICQPAQPEYYPCGSRIKYFSCHKCSFKATSKLQLQKHKGIVHRRSEQKLAGESAKASSPKTFYKPILWFQLRPFSCSLCKFRCKNSFTLRHHQARHQKHGRTGQHQCTLCSYAAGSSRTLGMHMNNGHYLDILPDDPPSAGPDHVGKDGKKIKLLRSSSSLVKFQALDPENEPRSKARREKERTLSCSSCGFRSAWESKLKIHLKLHGRKSALTCSQCSYSPTSLSQLNLHLSRDHPDIESPTNQFGMGDEDKSEEEEPRPASNTVEVPVYHCPVCPWWKRYISNFHAHMLTHTSSPAYMCSNCDYSAKSWGKVSDHIRQKKEVKYRTHSSARVVFQPLPDHRYAAYLRPTVVPKGAQGGRSLLLSGGGGDQREETRALRERVEVMERKMREALEEAERISARREKLRMRMMQGAVDRKSLEKEDGELVLELQLAEWSRIGAEQVLGILQKELKSLDLATAVQSS